MSKKKEQSNSKTELSVTGCIFSKDKNEVLLIKRRDVPVWVLPGGGLLEKESPEEAIKREIAEETGYEVQIKRKVGTYFPINRLAKLTYLYECTIVSGKAITSSETKEVTFFPLDKLPPLLPPPYDEWIEDTKKNLLSPIERKLFRVNYFTLFKNFFLHPHLVIRFLLAKIGLTINT